jgi:small-conductance mechanosensitive channel
MNISQQQILQIILDVIYSVLAVGAFAIIVLLCNKFIDKEKVHSGLMLSKKHKLMEFSLFKIALYVFLLTYTILLLMQLWNVPSSFLNNIKISLYDGTSIYGIRFVPMRLILAIMIFAAIQVAWRYTLLYMVKIHRFNPQSDSHIFISSIIFYIVFAIALLSALAISGVDFTGLAIIAGALSVGIGFGLQNIVNNFVSGIIILLEKTIQPGDRVLIKGQEGFVREISFRYTILESMQKETVIIPNSDIMTTPIINYVYEDSSTKIKCHLGVAYNSDMDLVKQVLLNVAAKHTDVLHDPLNQPIVYMKEFGESNVIFDLQCTILDINKRDKVSSDLNFAIAKAFRENGIVMAFPQRAVHIINS